MRTRKQIILLMIVLIFIINSSIVYSSWYDWSRYEQDGYSFKIPEGFHHTLGHGTDDNNYLVDNLGGSYTDFGSNRISIRVSNKINTENMTLLLKYNDTINIYTHGNSTTGVYETDNGTFISISVYCWQHRIYDNERMEQDVNIIKGMFESVKVD